MPLMRQSYQPDLPTAPGHDNGSLDRIEQPNRFRVHRMQGHGVRAGKQGQLGIADREAVRLVADADRCHAIQFARYAVDRRAVMALDDT